MYLNGKILTHKNKNNSSHISKHLVLGFRRTTSRFGNAWWHHNCRLLPMRFVTFCRKLIFARSTEKQHSPTVQYSSPLDWSCAGRIGGLGKHIFTFLSPLEKNRQLTCAVQAQLGKRIARRWDLRITPNLLILKEQTGHWGGYPCALPYCQIWFKVQFLWLWPS